MSEKQAAVSGEESLASKEVEYGFKERTLSTLSQLAEKVFMKAVEANSQNIASFMANVSEYEIQLDSIEGGFETPQSSYTSEGGKEEGIGHGSFKMSGFSLKMKMRDNK